MSLSNATSLSGPISPIEGNSPYRIECINCLAGVAFKLKAGDPRLEAIHLGEPSPTPQMDNLEGMVRAWDENPEWLDFLDPTAPNHSDKLLERDLYMHHWKQWLPTHGRVMDLGGGVGRFTTWLLERGLDVEHIDPDLRSIWRALQHCVNLQQSNSAELGRVDFHWTTGEKLPNVEPVDTVIAAEVLCYVEDPEAVLQEVKRILKPGGVFLSSVEARWGWAASLDVAPGTLKALLSDGVVHVAGDRWIQTFSEEKLRELFKEWDILYLMPTHYIPSGPYEAAGGELNLIEIIDLEAQLRSRPATTHQNRAWMIVARPK
jgi:SAM-dependent methyltransferase